jgi:hypothetical protein
VREWVARQIGAFGQLAERRIASYEGIESAIVEADGAGLPGFHDGRVPCLQFDVLGGCEGVFRFRAVPELPAGLVHSVATSTSDRGNLSAVSLFIAQSEIRLLAGEIEERPDGSLVFHRDDESVLVFANAADVAAVQWAG